MTAKKWELCKCFLKLSSATLMKGTLKVRISKLPPLESGSLSTVAGPLPYETPISNTPGLLALLAPACCGLPLPCWAL